MRRTAAVLLLLLTASSAQAGMQDGVDVEMQIRSLGCCCVLPFSLMLLPVILLAIYDWRKARRPAPPAEDE